MLNACLLARTSKLTSRRPWRAPKVFFSAQEAAGGTQEPLLAPPDRSCSPGPLPGGPNRPQRGSGRPKMGPQEAPKSALKRSPKQMLLPFWSRRAASACSIARGEICWPGSLRNRPTSCNEERRRGERRRGRDADALFIEKSSTLFLTACHETSWSCEPGRAYYARPVVDRQLTAT